jgi:hypothetical protein
MVAAIEAGVPTLVEAREIITQFHLMIRRRLETGLTPWIERARASLIASFASGVAGGMKRRFERQSLRHGPTDRLKVRSRASS